MATKPNKQNKLQWQKRTYKQMYPDKSSINKALLG